MCMYPYIHFEPDPHTAHQPRVFHRGPLMPGMHGPLGFTTGGCPAATPARPQQPSPKGAPWLPTAGHGRVDSTPTLAAGHFILHHQVDFSSCTPGRHLRLGVVTQQGPSRARSAGRSAVLGGKPQQGEFKAIPRQSIHTYIYIYIYIIERERERERVRDCRREGKRGESDVLHAQDARALQLPILRPLRRSEAKGARERRQRSIIYYTTL